jgi:ligand-binding SRPBCC domain-containing protein
MHQFRHELMLNAPIERAAEFHHSSEALKQLTPPPY